MNKLLKEEFKMVEKFIVTKGDNFNDDRCFILAYNFWGDDTEVTCCADEIENEIRICQINGVNATELESKRYMKDIVKLAQEATYKVKEENDYLYYINEIKTITECCDLNCMECSGCVNNN